MSSLHCRSNHQTESQKLQMIAEKEEKNSKRIWGTIMYDQFGSTTNWDINKLVRWIKQYDLDRFKYYVDLAGNKKKRKGNNMLKNIKEELGCKTNEDLIQFMLENPKHPRVLELKEVMKFMEEMKEKSGNER